MSLNDLDAITLHGMSFHTLIGVLPHEREHPQPLEIDLTAWVHPGEKSVVDYRQLYTEVRTALQAPSLFYLEELANSIAGPTTGRVMHKGRLLQYAQQSFEKDGRVSQHGKVRRGKGLQHALQSGAGDYVRYSLTDATSSLLVLAEQPYQGIPAL